MANLTKKRKAAAAKFDGTKLYDLAQAAQIVKQVSTTKVDATVDIAVRLGVDPKTGKNVYAKLGKYGAYIQVGENPDDNGGEKPIFAAMRQGQFIENITLSDALELR